MLNKSEQAIVEHVVNAIGDHRLKAGTKLGEQTLSEIFNCSRAHVRRALLVLSSQKVVELIPNRGAYVATPTADEAKNVFQARRAIEGTIVRNAIRNASRKDVERMRKHAKNEQMARASSDRREAIRLSGQFHLVLAEVARNDVLEGFLRELVMRTSLIISLYASSRAPLCEDHDHVEIIDAIDSGDEEKALDLMDAHLRHLESSAAIEGEPKLDNLHAILGVG